MCIGLDPMAGCIFNAQTIPSQCCGDRIPPAQSFPIPIVPQQHVEKAAHLRHMCLMNLGCLDKRIASG